MKKYIDNKDLDKKLEKYLELENIVVLDIKTTDRKIENLLLVFVEDFLSYKLFLDDFSSLCEKMLGVLQNKKKDVDSDLFMICHYGAELSWYIRNEPSKAASFMESILKYYENSSSKP